MPTSNLSMASLAASNSQPNDSSSPSIGNQQQEISLPSTQLSCDNTYMHPSQHRPTRLADKHHIGTRKLSRACLLHTNAPKNQIRSPVSPSGQHKIHKRQEFVAPIAIPYLLSPVFADRESDNSPPAFCEGVTSGFWTIAQ